MKIEGKSISIERPIEEVYHYLHNYDNIGKLMPEQVTNWKSNDDSCSFTIQGMANISMSFGKNNPPEEIVLIPKGNPPFSFSIHAKLSEEGTITNVRVLLDADLNPMLAMMAKRPLENLVNVMADHLQSQFT